MTTNNQECLVGGLSRFQVAYGVGLERDIAPLSKNAIQEGLALTGELTRIRSKNAEIRTAALRLISAIEQLGEIHEYNGKRITYFEGSPTKNAECFKRWTALNHAIVDARAAMEASRPEAAEKKEEKLLAFSFDDHCALMDAKHPDWRRKDATSYTTVALEFWEAALSSATLENEQLRSSLAAAQREAAEAKRKLSLESCSKCGFMHWGECNEEIASLKHEIESLQRDREQWIKPAIDAIRAIHREAENSQEYRNGRSPWAMFLLKTTEPVLAHYQLPQKQESGAVPSPEDVTP